MSGEEIAREVINLAETFNPRVGGTGPLTVETALEDIRRALEGGEMVSQAYYKLKFETESRSLADRIGEVNDLT